MSQVSLTRGARHEPHAAASGAADAAERGARGRAGQPPPDDLAAHVVRTLVERAADPERIDEPVFGAANQAGEDNRNVARMAGLLAGLPTSVPGTTVNRLCGSSLDAAMQASRAIETGDMSCVIVGGVESMSRAPWVLLKPATRFRRGSIRRGRPISWSWARPSCSRSGGYGRSPGRCRSSPARLATPCSTFAGAGLLDR
jgi:acetyl-CoA acetyltransferase